MTNYTFYHILLFSGLLAATAVQANDLENQYKNALISQAGPALKAMLKERYRGMKKSDEDISSEAEHMVQVFAECNVEAFDAYSPKFRSIAFETVGNGGSWADSKQALNTAFGVAIQSGELSESDFMREAQESKRIFTECGRTRGLDLPL